MLLKSYSAIKVSEAYIGQLYSQQAYGATIAFFGPFSALYFLFYQTFKTQLLAKPNQPTFYQSLGCAGVAGALAGFITNPLDIVKLRMQVQRAQRSVGKTGGSFGYRNIFDGIYKLIRQEGVLALFRGSYIRVLFTFPMTALSMSLTQHFKQVLNKNL